MQGIFVVDRNKQPLMPCHPARARELLRKGKAAVYRRYPFTLILTEREGGEVQPTQVKIDPGSRTTGIVVVVDGKRGPKIVFGAELMHRGHTVKEALDSRRAQRRSRRARHTRYRAPRFNNRRRRAGWLPPSIRSRLDNVTTWIARLRRLCYVSALAQELVRFDTQRMHNAEISGIEYQQGTLAGYEVRQFLLEKWNRTCVYCGAKNTPLEVEHIVPRSRGGSDRVSNLTLACRKCNQDKGHQTAAEFGYPNVQAQAQQPLRDTVAVNVTRWTLYQCLVETGLPVEVGTGGRTQFNRTRRGYPKTHWLDATCVGESGAHVYAHPRHAPLLIKATGRGSRQMCKPDQYGFPRTAPKAAKRVHGFQTGDMVRAVVLSGKKIGTYIGRVAVRTSGSFNITTASGTIQGISHRHCALIQHSDGYAYLKGECAIPPPAFRQGSPGAER